MIAFLIAKMAQAEVRVTYHDQKGYHKSQKLSKKESKKNRISSKMIAFLSKPEPWARFEHSSQDPKAIKISQKLSKKADEKNSFHLKMIAFPEALVAQARS